MTKTVSFRPPFPGIQFCLKRYTVLFQFINGLCPARKTVFIIRAGFFMVYFETSAPFAISTIFSAYRDLRFSMNSTSILPFQLTTSVNRRGIPTDAGS